jgi:hypothetical protein
VETQKNRNIWNHRHRVIVTGVVLFIEIEAWRVKSDMDSAETKLSNGVLKRMRELKV